ncbi:calcium/sodium antiporter [candidate division KSB1 bacterium]|nr:calcium/sodium antiporter [candidate division KSB1 bacterium]
MILPILALIGGLALLAWSADIMVDGASGTARHMGLPSLLIGMLIVGFGTSAPELVVSAIASVQGNPGLALGNAYGSNIANIALILGVAALISPILVHSKVLKRELPVLMGVTALALFQLSDGFISRADALILLIIFLGLVGWSIREGYSQRHDAFGDVVAHDLDLPRMSLKPALWRLIGGIVFLVVSSRMLVWGAVEIAEILHISDTVIGLTVVAIGTSLPELASAVAAVRKNEHDLALGNVIGSNLFNTLAVVGLAGIIHPIRADAELLVRDGSVMGVLTLSLFVIGFGFRGQGRINRWEACGLLAIYIAYLGFHIWTQIG